MTETHRKDVMHCIGCQKPIEDLHGDGETPTGALVFTSHGNYGSVVFDSMHRWLKAFICDDCVKAAASRGDVLIGTPSGPAPRPKYEPFDPADPAHR